MQPVIVENLLIVLGAVLAAFLLLVVPALYAPRIADWLTRRVADHLGLNAYRRPVYHPFVEELLVFLGFHLPDRCEHPALANVVPRSLADMVIVPGDGFGTARLGMSPVEIEALFGPPLELDAWDDGNVNGSLIYDGVRLTFDRHDGLGPLDSGKLDGVEIRRPDAVLLDRPVAAWSEVELVAELIREGLTLQESQPGYALFTQPYLVLWFEAGRLCGVAIATE